MIGVGVAALLGFQLVSYSVDHMETTYAASVNAKVSMTSQAKPELAKLSYNNGT
ncbi:hypothetical protein FRFR103141_07045 [Fructilactobacillus fructivorans]|uniref:hypothetical protein n=1 Tax=Fructilactobacillus fructivorans TaxID=1614 RepID=UPI000713593E|nr:hypothetical protein [Fructilactobacillus fructivorans]KRN39697.1 hypothetical protein IV51_GL000885 [Fructilactobacillus fructivorans]